MQKRTITYLLFATLVCPLGTMLADITVEKRSVEGERFGAAKETVRLLGRSKWVTRYATGKPVGLKIVQNDSTKPIKVVFVSAQKQRVRFTIPAGQSRTIHYDGTLANSLRANGRKALNLNKYKVFSWDGKNWTHSAK